MKKLSLKIEHQIPGRIRMKVPAGKGNPDLLEKIRKSFGVVPGIEQVAVNPITGSVVLEYDERKHEKLCSDLQQRLPSVHRPPPTEIDELADKLEQEAEFLAEHSHLAQGIVDAFKGFDREIKAATGNLIDLKIVLAAAIIGITIFEVGATAATPVWVTLVVFSLNHFVEMNLPTPKGASAPPTRMA
jgi:hypothetical protein